MWTRPTEDVSMGMNGGPICAIGTPSMTLRCKAQRGSKGRSRPRIPPRGVASRYRETHAVTAVFGRVAWSTSPVCNTGLGIPVECRLRCDPYFVDSPLRRRRLDDAIHPCGGAACLGEQDLRAEVPQIYTTRPSSCSLLPGNRPTPQPRVRTPECAHCLSQRQLLRTASDDQTNTIAKNSPFVKA